MVANKKLAHVTCPPTSTVRGPETMAPTSNIYFTRHAQAEHVCRGTYQNVEYDYSIPDAPLTELGKRQASRLPALTPELQAKAEVVISSPLRRTLQTVALGYAGAVDRLGGHAKVVCLPQLQGMCPNLPECNNHACDTGSERSVLEKLEEFSGFDLSALTPEWISKKGFYDVDTASLARRAQWVRQYLRDRPEQEIVVVAHGDILRRITQQPYNWSNAEVRLFQFDPANVNDDECPLVFVKNIATGGQTDDTLASEPAHPDVPVLPTLADQGVEPSSLGLEAHTR